MLASLKALSHRIFGPMRMKERTSGYSSTSKNTLLFSNRKLIALLLPLVIEQFLNQLMGMADTMMVSRVGNAAISAVSLTDSINQLIIQIFTALAAGGTIVCSQYIGQKNSKRANNAARQLFLTVFAMSMTCCILFLLFRRGLLHLVFGSVSAEVMSASLTYFFYTVISYPFFALGQVGGALFRACGNSRFPMIVATASNLLNIAGNAVLIFGFGMGVAGAAISTLVSRIVQMVILLYFLRKRKQTIVLRDYYTFRPDFDMIRRVLMIGIPAGVENGMFQFGKLAIQSSVSTLGTKAIAANALDTIFESFDGVAGIGIGIGLMTIVGQCVGAGRLEESRYYIKKLALWAEIAITLSCLALFALGKPIIMLAGLKDGSARMCYDMLIFITVMKPILWVPSFIPPYGFRAAGDVRFSMVISSASMWICRVLLTIIMIRFFHFSIIAVWIGMFADWAVRGIIYTIHFFSGKWMTYQVI